MALIRLLTALQIDKLGPGFHADGGNLYLRVNAKNARSYVFRYQRGKPIDIGLGSTHSRTLAQARDVAGKMRNALAEGREPATVLAARRDPNALTFKVYAAELIEAKTKGFRSAKHAKQWGATLERYAYPTIGKKRPREITLSDVKAILKPKWHEHTETMSRVRQRIEAVLDYAAVSESEPGRYNPARWKGNLALAGFEAARKVTKVQHHPAAKYADVPAIMAALRAKDCTSAYCLRWTILTAARSMESRAAIWSEINEADKLWAIPGDRMKANRNHNVPLCDEALEIIETMKSRKVDGCDYLFPGAKGGLVSDVAINKMLHSIYSHDVTVHGFRSSFRQWGAETTSFPSAVLELALAHVDINKVQAAYQRSDLFEKRRELSTAWSKFCASKSNVLQFAKS